jgi:Pyruvate/2-oxoacid:ferredoxin oxidoreductase delta subunit
MPAIPEELAQVTDEGAKLLELTAPVEVERDREGRVTGLVCESMTLGEPDASGRRRPVPVKGSRHVIPCDQVVLAVGQKTNLEFAKSLVIQDDQLSTDEPKVFVSGDAANSAGTVTAAIGSGRHAALLIHRSLGGTLPEAAVAGWASVRQEVVTPADVNLAYAKGGLRAEQGHLPVATRIQGEDEVIMGLVDPTEEAKRCLTCGACTACDTCYTFCPEPAISRLGGVYHINLDYCKGCGVCFEECPRGAVDMVEERV